MSSLPNNFLPLTQEVKDMLMGVLTKKEWVIFNVLTELDKWGDRRLTLTNQEIFELVNQKQKVGVSTVRRALIKLKELGIFAIEQAYQVTVNYCFGIKQLRSEAKKDETTENKGDFKNEQESSEIRKESSFKKSLVQNKKNQASKPALCKDSKILQTSPEKKDFNTDNPCGVELKSEDKKIHFDERKNESSTKDEVNLPLLAEQKQVDSNAPKSPTILESLRDKLKVYGIYLEVFDSQSQKIIPNPKMEGIKKLIKGMEFERAERAILAYLAWLKDARSVNDKYAALASSLRKNWC